MTKLFNLRFAAVAFAALIIAIFMTTTNDTRIDAAENAANPLLMKWAGPYGGIPPFDKVKVSDFKPALEAAIAENLAEIDAIANDKSAPTFENTIAAMERAGSSIERVRPIYEIWGGNLSTPEFKKSRVKWNRSWRLLAIKLRKTRLYSSALRRFIILPKKQN